ncbi:hypothetical protein HDZ31DRAFT_41788, partial [Schizophyllum fasciatum]
RGGLHPVTRAPPGLAKAAGVVLEAEQPSERRASNRRAQRSFRGSAGRFEQSLRAAIRQLPARSLVPHFGTPRPAHEDVERLQAFQAALASAPVQEALKHAQLRGGSGKADVELSRLRRDIRKRRRPPSPESPLPYNAEQQPAEKAIFPSAEGGPLTVSEVPEFVRGFNRAHAASAVRVHVWLRRRGDAQANMAQMARGRPLVLRVTIANVLTAYLGFGVQDDEGGVLCAESVVVLGPREKVRDERHRGRVTADRLGFAESASSTVRVCGIPESIATNSQDDSGASEGGMSIAGGGSAGIFPGGVLTGEHRS